jgi:TetR/AcrR family transcriptional regulator, cholesterol catabolism regulator
MHSNMVTVVSTGGRVVTGSADAELSAAPDPIIEIVVDLLDTGGDDAVQLREVARRARVSLSTIYKRYATRDELIAAALEWWMDNNRYARLPSPDEGLGDSLYDDLMRVFRTLFEPWEPHPLMLKSYFRARSGPGGHRLIQRGVDAVVPLARAILSRLEPNVAKDLELVLTGVIFGFLGQFVQGEIEVTDIMPGIERAVFWLTASCEPS